MHRPLILLALFGIATPTSHAGTLVDQSRAPTKQRNRSIIQSSSTLTSTLRERKPNIVLILTDDQDVELGSLNFMPKTLRTLRDNGAQFRHAYVTTPMCCPSRSSLLTGMYVHNHHVYTNNDNCSSSEWQATHETRSFATYLSNAGYRTGYFGKYLNKYNGSYIPPGWREWGGLIMNSKYYNYSINMNGKKIKHGFDYQKDYYSDLITNDSIAFLRQSKKNNAHKPVMLTMSFPAPHGPEDSAPQYSHLFFNVTTHHTPSYDYAPNPDKQWILQVTQKMQPIHRSFTDLLMTKRLQTLQSVDAAVQRVVDELEILGELQNTYIVYTSDHGYHLGQFGLIKGKSFPFEFDVRVPFLVRGPGVEPGTVVDDIVLNIDLAPTFLDIAGVEAPPHMDGRSVLPLFLNSKKRKRTRWPDTFLIESSGRRETPFYDARIKAAALRMAQLPVYNTTPNYTSTTSSTTTMGTTESTTTTTVRSAISDGILRFSVGNALPTKPILTTTVLPTIPMFHGSSQDVLSDVDSVAEDDNVDAVDDDEDEDVEDENITKKYLVDLEDNPNQNASAERKGDELYIENKLPQTPTNKLERLALECAQPKMKAPCRRAQKWYCTNENGRWRKHKCKFTTIATPSTQFAENKYFRKCACFTPQGLVYRRIPVASVDFPRHRIKRLRSVLRERRDVTTIDGIPSNSSSSSTSLDDPLTNRIVETIGNANCRVIEGGRVNCSTIIYRDRKTWRRSRHRIDNEIYQLKQKLEELKEIRRHLKNSRPYDQEQAIANRTITDVKKRKKLPVDGVSIDLTSPSSSPAPPHAHRHKHDEMLMSSTMAARHNSATTQKPKTTTEWRMDGFDDYARNDYSKNYCHCESDEPPEIDEKELAKEAKRRLKEERLRRKLRKQRKKDQMEKECSSERMNCFRHDNDHWKTEPRWTDGPFCFCMNANNNTYSCVRTINSTHNFLYCEFTTGLVTFYNLRIDPYELQNRVGQLKPEERLFLHEQLKRLVACKGRSCSVTNPHAVYANATRPRLNFVPPYRPFPIPLKYRKRKTPTDEHNQRPMSKNRNVTIAIADGGRERRRT